MVLHVRCINGKGGGPEKTILNSPRFLDDLGFDSCCAYLHAPGDGAAICERARQSRAPIVSVDDNGPFDWSLVKNLRRICREKKVVIWHGHDYKTDLLGLLVRRSWPMKLITTVHGWVEHTWRTPLYHAIDRFAIRRYDQVLCVSQDLHEHCLGLGIAEDKCHLIHNAIDTSEFKRAIAPIAARALLGEAPSGLVLGAMGRLSPEKGFDLLIRAVSQIQKNGRGLTLWIAGEGNERGALQDLIDRLGCSNTIKLIGHTNDVKAFFQSLDIFVLSSHREGLPNVVLEAMALETPVIATRVAGLPRLINDGENGVLINPGSIDELVSSITRLAGEASQRSRLTANARKVVERSFSFKNRMEDVARIYRHTLHESR